MQLSQSYTWSLQPYIEFYLRSQILYITIVHILYSVSADSYKKNYALLVPEHHNYLSISQLKCPIFVSVPQIICALFCSQQKLARHVA